MSSYCTPTELRTQIEKEGTTGSASDANLEVIIAGVSNTLDQYFNRPDGFVASAIPSARYFSSIGAKSYIMIDDCVEITAVAVKESPTDDTYTAWTASDWIAFTGDVQHPIFNRLPYTGIMTDPAGSYEFFTDGSIVSIKGFRPYDMSGRSVPTVQVTARWGYGEIVLPLIKEVTIALASRWFKSAEGQWSDTLASSGFGGLIYKSQNADIRLMLDSARLGRPSLGA